VTQIGAGQRGASALHLEAFATLGVVEQAEAGLQQPWALAVPRRVLQASAVQACLLVAEERGGEAALDVLFQEGMSRLWYWWMHLRSTACRLCTCRNSVRAVHARNEMWGYCGSCMHHSGSQTVFRRTAARWLCALNKGWPMMLVSA
jgi:hypothetical protein